MVIHVTYFFVVADFIDFFLQGQGWTLMGLKGLKNKSWGDSWPTMKNEQRTARIFVLVFLFCRTLAYRPSVCRWVWYPHAPRYCGQVWCCMGALIERKSSRSTVFFSLPAGQLYISSAQWNCQQLFMRCHLPYPCSMVVGHAYAIFFTHFCA